MELPNLTARETVSQSKFWLLWTTFVAISIMSGFVNNYQKTFGMKFITDDFFFTYVGLASNLINGSSRIMWGYVHDLKGFKVIFVKVNCHNIIFQIFMLLLKILDHIIFLFQLLFTFCQFKINSEMSHIQLV